MIIFSINGIAKEMRFRAPAVSAEAEEVPE